MSYCHGAYYNHKTLWFDFVLRRSVGFSGPCATSIAARPANRYNYCGALLIQLDFNRGVAKDSFTAFLQRAVALQSSQLQEASDINLVVIDYVQELNLSTFSQKIQNFRGADLIFIDIPNVNTAVTALFLL